MQESKTRIVIIILIILIIIVAVGGTALYLTTDLLKSSETLFQKYLLQDIQNIAEVFDVSEEEKMIDLLRKSDYSEKTNATLKYLENQNDEEEIYQIKENGNIKSSEKASYRNITASFGDTELMSVDLLKQDNKVGFRLANLVQQFVSVENATVSYFISSMGYDAKYFSETLQGVEISGLLDFSEEEIQTLANTYFDVIFSDINASNYSSKRKVMRTLNNKESVKTNTYTLTITQNDFDRIYKRVLNQAISDKIILGKLEKIDAKIQEAGFVEPEGESLKERYVAKLQELVSHVEYQGEDTRKITFTVYESDGITVRTEIQTETQDYILDLDQKNGKTLSLKTSQPNESEEQSKIYLIGKADNEQERTRTIGYQDGIQNLEISMNSVSQESQIKMTTNLIYNNEKITNLEFGSDTMIQIGTTEAIPIYFDENNNILLNNYEGENILSILENLKNRFIVSLEESQSKINTKLLNNINLYIDKIEQQRAQQQKDDEELQRQRFNNQFVLYGGENLESEYIQKLIKVAGQNMSDYEVVSGSQIRIFIEKGTVNEAKAEEISAAISNRYTYNVTISYSEDQYVQSVDISVYKKP